MNISVQITVRSDEGEAVAVREVLPVHQEFNTAAIQRQVRRTAERLEAERGEGRDVFFDASVRDGNVPLESSAPWIVGLDGAYVHAKDQRSRIEGWFEVIVGKSLPTQDKAPKCFGFVSRYDPQPERRFSAWLEGQGLQSNQPVTFLSDGGDTVRELPRGIHPRSEYLLDWFHVTMQLTGMSRLAKGVRAEDYPELSADLEQMLEHLKWNLWHGKVARALEIVDELVYALNIEEGSPEHRKLLKAARAFETYLINNRAFIPNYGERYRKGKIISTAFVESTVNQLVSKRFVKKQQMRWTPAGAHLLLQIRTQELNEQWRPTLSRWYPGLRETSETKAD